MPKLQISIIPSNGMNGISAMKGVSMNSPPPKIHTKQNVSPSGTTASPIDLIQELLQDEFTCPVCYQPCKNTYINTTCNRRYCSSCIGEGISKCNTDCSTCSKIVPANTQENTVKRDLSADRVIAGLFRVIDAMNSSPHPQQQGIQTSTSTASSSSIASLHKSSPAEVKVQSLPEKNETTQKDKARVVKEENESSTNVEEEKKKSGAESVNGNNLLLLADAMMKLKDSNNQKSNVVSSASLDEDPQQKKQNNSSARSLSKSNSLTSSLYQPSANQEWEERKKRAFDAQAEHHEMVQQMPKLAKHDANDRRMNFQNNSSMGGFGMQNVHDNMDSYRRMNNDHINDNRNMSFDNQIPNQMRQQFEFANNGNEQHGGNNMNMIMQNSQMQRNIKQAMNQRQFDNYSPQMAVMMVRQHQRHGNDSSFDHSQQQMMAKIALQQRNLQHQQQGMPQQQQMPQLGMPQQQQQSFRMQHQQQQQSVQQQEMKMQAHFQNLIPKQGFQGRHIQQPNPSHNFGNANNKKFPVSEERGPGMKVVEPSDASLATSFSFAVLSEVESCCFRSNDSTGKRKLPIGFSGLACKYCQGNSKQLGGRLFPSTIKTMSDTNKTLLPMHTHLMRCPFVPKDTKLKLESLKCSHYHEKKNERIYGSQKRFFSNIWRRIHGTDPV